MSTDQETVRSYDAIAFEYAAEAAAMPEWVETEIDVFVTELGGTGRVLEIGSGGGRDALALEKRGLSVRRTDISKGFVELLRESGFEADILDPLTEDLSDPARPGTPYDGVWACACLIHVARKDFRCLGGLPRQPGPVADCTPRLERAMARWSPHQAVLQTRGGMSRLTGANLRCGPPS